MRLCTREAKLHSLPYDIFYQVVEDLDLSDFNNLSRVNRSLYNLLQNDQLAKRTIKVRLLQEIGAPHTQKIEQSF
jgi:hypothetical protein